MNSEDATSSGVQELIERLHQEGLAKGQEQADEIVTTTDMLPTLAKLVCELLLLGVRLPPDLVLESLEPAER